MILENTIEFSSAHFYNYPKWTQEKNETIFGKCYTPNGHGHNYQLQVFTHADIKNPGELQNAHSELQQILKEVIEELDHQHLNFTIDHFKDNIPTTENISVFILNKLRKYTQISLLKLRLKELNSLWVEITL